jgi:hypothetical protein
MIMKIVYQLLKFSSKSGPLDLFPDWNVFTKFLNLNYDEVKEKDFELFCQAVVTLLNISNKPNFLERVNVIELLKHCYDGVVGKLYQNREMEMKNIILEIIKNIFYNDSKNKAEKLNNIFRNKSFNAFELIMKLFEPFFTTNVPVSSNKGKYNGLRRPDFGIPGNNQRHSAVQVGDEPELQVPFGAAEEDVLDDCRPPP